ncbi:MAG: hypothetical protein LBE95_01425 [Holosporaceae bacterium]|jgi:hypothetical protein|nr:hypothetical protein [Holosporaceae bacterium]
MPVPGNNRGFEMFNSTTDSSHNLLDQSDASLNAPKGGSKTPQYVIKSDDDSSLFDSDMKDDFAKCAPVLWWEFGGARLITLDSSGQQSGDGKIVNKDVKICMKSGDWNPLLQQWMYEGKRIASLVVMRLASIEGTLIVIQEVTFEKCIIRSYVQSGDTIVFTFCFVVVTDMIKAYDHEGTLVGNVGVKYHVGEVSVESISG